MTLSDFACGRVIVTGSFNEKGELLPNVSREYLYTPRSMPEELRVPGMCHHCKSQTACMILFSHAGTTCGHNCYCLDCVLTVDKKCSTCGFVGIRFVRVVSRPRQTPLK